MYMLSMQRLMLPKTLYIAPSHRKLVTRKFDNYRASAASDGPSFDTVKVYTDGPAGVITISKPKALNALNTQARYQLTIAHDFAIAYLQHN